ncbi:MAG: hypothetical protein GKS06_12735 [Acidobacteria bacterium]|nr:hypothetical protein [Acidobacteriota bacterium]
MKRGVGVVALLLIIIACAETAPAPLMVQWEPVEALNASLPETIRVYSGTDPEAPLRAWSVRIEASPELGVRVAASTDTDGVEIGSEFAEQSDARVVLNGGYFRMGESPMRHVGLLMVDGEIIEPAMDSVLRDGERYFLARGALGFLPGGQADVAWVSSRDGVLYEWVSPPPNAAELPVTGLDFDELKVWPAHDALAAGPVLVMDGQIHVATDAEVFFGTAIPELNPRTAAGVTPEGDLVLVVIDGRQRESRGVDLLELANIMLELGVDEAVNLDGGGSSTLVVDGVLVNRPLGAQIEREVMSALLVVEK